MLLQHLREFNLHYIIIVFKQLLLKLLILCDSSFQLFMSSCALCYGEFNCTYLKLLCLQEHFAMVTLIYYFHYSRVRCGVVCTCYYINNTGARSLNICQLYFTFVVMWLFQWLCEAVIQCKDILMFEYIVYFNTV